MATKDKLPTFEQIWSGQRIKVPKVKTKRNGLKFTLLGRNPSAAKKRSKRK